MKAWQPGKTGNFLTYKMLKTKNKNKWNISEQTSQNMVIIDG